MISDNAVWPYLPSGVIPFGCYTQPELSQSAKMPPSVRVPTDSWEILSVFFWAADQCVMESWIIMVDLGYFRNAMENDLYGQC